MLYMSHSRRGLEMNSKYWLKSQILIYIVLAYDRNSFFYKKNLSNMENSIEFRAGSNEGTILQVF